MAIFARRHYQAIAKVFALRNANVYQTQDEFVVDCDMAETFCEMFSRDNPNFKKERLRFLKACEMEDE